MKRVAIFVMAVCVLSGFQSSVFAYDVTSTVPDVDKSSLPPLPGDMSCWQAAAANLLGGGGWGDADTIYGHMTSHFGTARPGKVELAMNWWLYNYGYNPDVGSWYQPGKTYNDATVVSKLLDHNDYDYLLNQISGTPNQYVAVSWEFHTAENTFNHALTLAGGNYSASSPAQSVWHDSDADVGGTDDDVYNNYFGAAPGPGAGIWHIDYTPLWQNNTANKYVMLCPGIQKPDSAMSNYDAAYFRDVNAETGAEEKVWRLAGQNDYGEPVWDPEQQGDNTRLLVPNQSDPDLEKRIYLLVDFEEDFYDLNNAPEILLEAEDPDNPGVLEQITATLEFSEGGGQILYTWELDFQPDEEYLIFPSIDFHDLGGDVKDFNIATECVPEPATMSLLAVGVVALLRRKRR